MCGNNESAIYRYAKGGVFTLREAQEIEREMLKSGRTGENLNWVNVKTRNPVAFSY